MMKRQNLIPCLLVVMMIALPVISFPTLARSNPTEFPTLNKAYNYNMESNLNSSKNDNSTKIISAIELQELIGTGSSEWARAAFTLFPFGDLGVKLHDWISEVWNRNLTKENKI